MIKFPLAMFSGHFKRRQLLSLVGREVQREVKNAKICVRVGRPGFSSTVRWLTDSVKIEAVKTVSHIYI